MAYVRWKLINGYGPYAYLQESYCEGGEVRTRHVDYLGTTGDFAPGAIVDLRPHGRSGLPRRRGDRPTSLLCSVRRVAASP